MDFNQNLNTQSKQSDYQYEIFYVLLNVFITLNLNTKMTLKYRVVLSVMLHYARCDEPLVIVC